MCGVFSWSRPHCMKRPCLSAWRPSFLGVTQPCVCLIVSLSSFLLPFSRVVMVLEEAAPCNLPSGEARTICWSLPLPPPLFGCLLVGADGVRAENSCCHLAVLLLCEGNTKHIHTGGPPSHPRMPVINTVTMLRNVGFLAVDECFSSLSYRNHQSASSVLHTLTSPQHNRDELSLNSAEAGVELSALQMWSRDMSRFSGWNRVDTERVLGGGALDRPPTKVLLQAETPVGAGEQRVHHALRARIPFTLVT